MTLTFKSPDEINGFTPSEPGITCVQIDSDDLLVLEAIKNLLHAVDGVGYWPMRLNEYSTPNSCAQDTGSCNFSLMEKTRSAGVSE